MMWFSGDVFKDPSVCFAVLGIQLTSARQIDLVNTRQFANVRFIRSKIMKITTNTSGNQCIYTKYLEDKK